MLEIPNKSRWGGELCSDFPTQGKKAPVPSPICDTTAIQCRAPHMKTKIRAAVLWAAMVAAMVASSGIANAAS